MIISKQTIICPTTITPSPLPPPFDETNERSLGQNQEKNKEKQPEACRGGGEKGDRLPPKWFWGETVSPQIFQTTYWESVY